MTLRTTSLVLPLAAAWLLTPRLADAQTFDFAFRGADVYTGLIFPTRSDRGATLGATVWLGSALHPRIGWGVGLQYGSADRVDEAVAVRTISFSIDLTRRLASGRLYPYLGLTGSLLSADATVLSPTSDPPAESLAEDLDGYRLGGGGFAGLGFQLTETGSVGFLLEYRLVGAPDVTYQAARAGIRFAVGGG
ncbi:MAG: hypothetical protein ACREKI_01630 [Gemmatimonadota bacterium]